VRSASFFRTHPPFLERILSTFSEIEYLPPRRELRLTSNAFDDAKKRSTLVEGKIPVASIDDIIKSKRAAFRQKDKEVLARLEAFAKYLKGRK